MRAGFKETSWLWELKPWATGTVGMEGNEWGGGVERKL